ncbi:hypothetical protein M409DRAFT_29447 [Zasmidium cellare ATCC 36951]|uniref:DUF7730 domain-containing protein n=1 Tax=Zasmidium cellare ATCC 36951 TaxID=1080233 RepID=A0A6A6C2R0_ZASCE|nr:uncharacterized protein M409DRAFT_29447 [Zasmidium cellare ATCC 36951]KAF2160152.1 hypothetical protein M409DRAFT_29447 [Zasmidium cellare ATCC 36951]
MADPNAATEKLDNEDAPHALHESRRPLRIEIEHLVAPYLYAAERPPFTATTLIAMAVICSSYEYVSTKQILSWIVRRFYYYKMLAIDEYSPEVAAYVDTNQPTDLEMLIDGSYEAFHSYDNPLQVREERTKYKSVYIYSIKPNHARVYLSGLLAPPCKSPFRLLDLPPELRVRIYELVLHFHDSEIVTRWQPGHKFGLSTLSSHIAENDEHWHDQTIRQKNLATLPEDVDALLVSCRRVRHEARPIFFGTNCFSFPLEYTYLNLQQFYTQELAFLKKLSIRMRGYRPLYTHRYLNQATKALEQLTALDECTFYIDDTFWVDSDDEDPVLARYEDLEEFRGLVAVAARGKKVNVHPDPRYSFVPQGCEQFQAFIDKAVMKRRSYLETQESD